MGHSQVEKQKTHEKIVAIASRRLRERGLDGVGVADLMKEAGLTVGGFYKHFASRDELVAEAMELAFGFWETQVRAEGKAPADIPIAEYAEDYLSMRHRDDTSCGCAFAALAADIARSGEKTRAIATEQLKHNFENMTERLGGPDREQARRNAIVASCLMTGAVGLARVSDDEAFSNEILETVKAFVSQLGAK